MWSLHRPRRITLLEGWCVSCVLSNAFTGTFKQPYATLRLAIFAMVAWLQPVAAWIALHVICFASMSAMPALRAVSSARPRYLPSPWRGLGLAAKLHTTL